MRQQRDGTPSPLGTATLSRLAVEHPGAELPAHLDAWIAAYGLPFAAAALVETAHLDVSRLRGTWEAAVRASREQGVPRALAGTARLLRTYLAAAPDEVYAATVRTLAECRRDLRQRVVVSYLLPTESAWLAEACREAGKTKLTTGEWRPLVALLHCSVARPEEVAALRKRRLFHPDFSDLGVVATAVESLGVAALDLFATVIASRTAKGEGQRAALEVIARIPGDEAFAVLTSRLARKYVQAIVIEAAELFPRRAIRMLAAAGCAEDENAEIARHLLAGRVARHPELIAAVRPGLPDLERALVDDLCARAVGRPEAPASALPALLVSPPWAGKQPRGSAKRTAGDADRMVLQPPAVSRAAWKPGEREEYAERGEQILMWGRPKNLDEARAAIEQHGTTGRIQQDCHLLLVLPEDEARRVLGLLRTSVKADSELRGFRAVFARLEADALEPLLRAEGVGSAGLAEILQPIVDLRVARLMAKWLRLKGSVRTRARTWFARHAEQAAALLVPDALGADRALRAAAERALRELAGGGGFGDGDGVAEVAARVYGPAAAGAVRAVVDVDPIDLAPARPPKLPDWLCAAPLPQILLRDRRAALPAESVRHVLTMLAISLPGEPYAGLEIVGEHTDPVSLAAFGRALLSAWRSADYPSSESWILSAQGTFGDAQTVRMLVPLALAWPREGGHVRATAALAVLAGIAAGSPRRVAPEGHAFRPSASRTTRSGARDRAPLELQRIARAFPRKALSQHASKRLAELSERVGLTKEQLLDRLLPDLGLDAEAALWLDYGARRFRVRYDEHLQPSVFDEAGRLLPDGLPAPGPADDRELAEAARERLAGLTEEAGLVVAHLFQRMESSMVMNRSWTAAEFRRLLLDHPLLRRHAGRVVWLGETDGLGTAFRVAEDLGFADIDDKEFALPERALVRVAHPVELGADLGGWAELFADYEIIQPFPQLGRPVYAQAEGDRPEDALARFAGISVPSGEVRALLDHEWDSAAEMNYGFTDQIVRATPDGRWLALGLAPGIVLASTENDEGGRLKLGPVTLRQSRKPPVTAPGTAQPAAQPEQVVLRELDPITASELLNDLYRLWGHH